MSQFENGKEAVVDTSRQMPARCRIPLRLNPMNKPTRVVQNKQPLQQQVFINGHKNHKIEAYCYDMRVDTMIQETQVCRASGRGGPPRPISSERLVACAQRAGACADTSGGRAPVPPAPRLVRIDRTPVVPRRPPNPKKLETAPFFQKRGKPISPIAVPHSSFQRGIQRMQTQMMPDQETIKKREDLELQGEFVNFPEEEMSSDVMKIKASWDEKMNEFDRMKMELEHRQKILMELYATLRNTHKMMTALGQEASMPSSEELKIMNVAKLTPEQLLQFCGHMRPTESSSEDSPAQKSSMSIDMSKVYEIPSKLVHTCEQTLIKRKEIIDWFQKLKTEEKGISMSKLTKKINEFNAENEMLQCSLESCKTEFMKDLNDIVDYLRKGVNETIALQLRTEELTYELSEINTMNAELRKQIQSFENSKLSANKHKIEEIEKELKEEKCKKLVMRDRLTRAEGQVKIGNERSTQLETALELARSQNWSLERTVQQLTEQNQKVQMEFEAELNKLTESIGNNTQHLEEIAEAREKLQAEKEGLEKRLQELSESYTEQLEHMKKELNVNIEKVVETENKFEEEKGERKKLESKLESLCAQVLESELRYKDALKQLQDRDEQLSKFMNLQAELETTQNDLEAANEQLDEYRSRMIKQSEAIQQIENNFKETIALEKELREDLKSKEMYITELQNKRSILEKQLNESEEKMESYDKQLTTLKKHIAQVQEQFGEEHLGDIENLNQLHEMINQQRNNLLETTRQNGELANALQQKGIEIENHLEHLAEQEHLLQQREDAIRRLTDKEEEHANIIKLLRNNLEMRAQADADLTQQLTEKNTEIDSLANNVETRKQQISQLEKIILTLEDQLRKVHLQRRKDQEKMVMLEKAITEYETYPIDKHSSEAPGDNLDNLIKILEEELGTAFEPKHDKHYTKSKYTEEHKKYETNDFERNNDAQMCPSGQEKGFKNRLVKPHLSANQAFLSSNERDNLDRKRAITSIDTQKFLFNRQPISVYRSSPDKDSLSPFRAMSPAVQLIPNPREEKKCKMFKLAGHRL